MPVRNGFEPAFVIRLRFTPATAPTAFVTVERMKLSTGLAICSLPELETSS
jgi:hypothetical protein